MKGILLVYWWSFLGTSLSMSRYHGCNFVEQVIQHSYDILQICVCSNQVYVNCSLNGAKVSTRNLTKKEELCYKSRIKLDVTTEQKTCVCSRLSQCHGEEERALVKNACARKAVMKMTPIRSHLETLCCDVQKALVRLWFRLEERVFLRLIKSISHDSLDTRMISRRLRRTKWCKAFHSECLEADMSILKGCKIRHKREIKETHRSYNTESVPFTTAITKGHEHTKQSSIHSTMADMTTTSTQTTGFLGAFTTRSTATTGDDEGKLLSMSGHWPTPPPLSSSSSSLSSISLSSSSISSSSSSPPPRKMSQGLLSSTSSSSPSHLSQNLSPVQSSVKPSTAIRKQSNTAELQTTFTSSKKMSTSFKDRMTKPMIERSTLSSSVEISSSPTVASSTKVTSTSTLTSSVTSKAQLDYSSSRSYSSISSSSVSLHVESSLLPSYSSPSTSSSSSLSPTRRHWVLGVTTKMRSETSTSPGMVSSESRGDETTAAFLTKEPSLSNVNEVTPVKEPSTHSLQTITLTPSMAQHDEFSKISDSSQVRTSTPMIMSRVASLVSSFDRRTSNTRRKPSLTLLGSSSIARKSTILPYVDIHSKYDSRISIPDRESLDLSSKIDITMMVTSPLSSTTVVPRSPVIFQETKVSISGSPSKRSRQTYEHSTSNVSITSSIKVIKRIPKTTVNETSSTPRMRIAKTISSWKTMAESTSSLYQSTLSLISLSSPSSSSLTTPLIALPFPTSLSSSATTILLMSISSSSLSPSLSVTASESSSPLTKQEMPVSRLNESKPRLPSVLEFATSSIQPSKSQILILTSHLSATSTPSVPIHLPPTETIRTLVPSPRRTSLLSSSSSSSLASSFHKIFVPESELLSSAVSSPSLVSPASTTLHVDISSVHTSSSLHKPLISTSVEPTLPLRRTSSSSSTTLHDYSIFTKEIAMGKISNSLSSVTLMSISSTISEQPTPSLQQYSYVATPPNFSSMSLLNQTMSMKAPVLLPSSPSSSAPKPLSSAPLSSTIQPLSSPSLSSSLSSPTPSSTQPLSSTLLPSSLSSSPTPSTQPLSSTSTPLLSSSLLLSPSPSTQPLSSTSTPLLPSSLSSSPTPSTQPLSSTSTPLLSSSLLLSPSPSTQPLSSTSTPLLPSSLLLSPSSATQPSSPLSSLTVQSLSSSTSQTLLSPSSQPISSLLSSSSSTSQLLSASSANWSFEWQPMLQVTKTSKRLTLSTQNEITESVQNNSTAARRPPVPPLSASSSLSSTPSPTLSLTSYFPSSSVKLFLSQPPVSAFIPSSAESPVLLTSVSSLLKSSPTSLSLPLATSTAYVTILLSSSQSLTSFTPVTPSSLTSTLLSSLPSTSLASSRQLRSSSPSLLPSLFLSSTSPMSTSSVSSSSSLLSTPPLSSSLMPSSSLSTSAPSPLSSPLLATPLPSSSLILSSSSSTSISSSLIPSSLQLSLSPSSTSLSSIPSSLGLLIPSSSFTPVLSTALSLMPTSLQSLSPTPSSSSLIPSLKFSPRSSMVTSSNVQLPKSDTIAKTFLPSKTLLVNQPSSPSPSEEPHIKVIFLAILDGNCLEVTSRESFKSAFIDTLSNLIGLRSDTIDILDIRCGSVEVVFSIIHKRTNKIAEVLDKLVKEDRMNIAFNGKTYRAISIRSLHPTTARPTALTPSIINPTNVLTAQINERRLVKILFILFLSIFGALALFGVVVCMAKICGRRRYSRIRLKTSTLSSRGTNQIYKNELELIRMSPLHRYADYYGGTNQEPHPKEESDEEDNINNRTALLNMLRNGEIASRRGKITVKDDDSYSSIAFY